MYIEALDKDGNRIVVQCINSKEPLDISEVKEIYNILTSSGAKSAYLVTTNQFTQGILAFANGKPIELLDYKETAKLIGNLIMDDFEEFDEKKCFEKQSKDELYSHRNDNGENDDNLQSKSQAKKRNRLIFEITIVIFILMGVITIFIFNGVEFRVLNFKEDIRDWIEKVDKYVDQIENARLNQSFKEIELEYLKKSGFIKEVIPPPSDLPKASRGLLSLSPPIKELDWFYTLALAISDYWHGVNYISVGNYGCPTVFCRDNYYKVKNALFKYLSSINHKSIKNFLKRLPQGSTLTKSQRIEAIKKLITGDIKNILEKNKEEFLNNNCVKDYRKKLEEIREMFEKYE